MAALRKHTVTWHRRGEDVEETTVYVTAQHHDDVGAAKAWNEASAVNREQYDGACTNGTAVVVEHDTEPLA